MPGTDGRGGIPGLVVLGGAGAGKSTLIGRLAGKAGAVAEPETASASEGGLAGLARAAATARAAVMVVDAVSGIGSETRRHTVIAAMMGLSGIVLAVNKMDLVGYGREAFETIARDYEAFAARAGIGAVVAVPVGALCGGNVVARSGTMPWYAGPSLLDALSGLGTAPGAAPAGLGAEVSDQFAATLLWTAEEPLIPERRYVLELGAARAGAAVTELKYRLNMDSLEHVAAKTVARDEVAFCNLALDRPVALAPVAADPALGRFLLVDRLTGAAAGMGTVAFPLRRATNLRWQALEIGKAELSALKSQRPAVIWLTGLSGAGKSTIANLVQKRLHAMGRHTYLLDGDNLRHGLNRDLGFVEADRVENIRRVAEVAKLFVASGTIVLVCLISPYRRERLMAREIMEGGEFIEVFVDTPLAVCEARDTKGLYRKARAGELINFTGIDAPYEPPHDSEITLDGATPSPEDAADAVLKFLADNGYLRGS
jgi:bifunctional enzyme CysN/CysC